MVCFFPLLFLCNCFSQSVVYLLSKKRKKISYDGMDFAKYSVKFSIGTKYTDAFQWKPVDPLMGTDISWLWPQ